MSLFSQIYKSYKYQQTFLPPVSLDDEWANKHLADEILSQKVKSLFQDQAARAAFCEPFDYDLDEIERRNKALKTKGFQLLSRKPYTRGNLKHTTPFYSVVEHSDVEGYVIKSGAARVKKDEIMQAAGNDCSEICFFSKEDSLLRLEVAERIKRVAQKRQIEVVVPEKKLVCLDPNENDPTKKYCILSQKIEVLSTEETIQTIRDLPQDKAKALAEKVCQLVADVGLVDCSFDNIRMTHEGKIAIIDTEPASLIVAEKKRHFWEKIITFFSGDVQSSVEKCARVGLHTLMYVSVSQVVNTGLDRLANDGIWAFTKVVQTKYKESCKFKTSETRLKQSKLISLMIAVTDAVRAYFREQILVLYSMSALFFNLIKDKKKEQYFYNIFSMYLSGVPFKRLC